MAEVAGKIVADFQYHIDSFVENNKCFGLNGHDEKWEFVPTVALTEFWTREKITTVLCSPKDMIKQSADTIFNHYLISFSVLVLNLNAESINLFIQEDLRDTQLPLPSVPEVYSDSASCGVFEEFIKRQWKFCPMSLDCGSSPKPSRRNLLPQRILPIVAKEKLNPEADEDGEQAVLFKVDLHPLCSQLGKPVVFKEYRQRTHETQRLFTNECDLYKQLREDSFGHIVTYYGSFECLGRSTIVLEFAPGGTLLSFFESRQPPRTDEQRKLFWGNLFGLFRGLQCIEDFTADHRHSRHTYRLKGTHQDIRPQNILVCGTSSDEDYSAPFKFVDMGTADIRKMRDGGYDRHAIDQRGNGMYSPPEACRDEGVATDIGDKSDTWALGAILSEALMWSIFGEAGRDRYQTERVSATGNTRLRGGYHEGAFHDGDSLLDVVHTWHTHAIEATGGSAARLSRFILARMLVPSPQGRGDIRIMSLEWESVAATLETCLNSEQNLSWPSTVAPLPTWTPSAAEETYSDEHRLSSQLWENRTARSIALPTSPTEVTSPAELSSPQYPATNHRTAHDSWVQLRFPQPPANTGFLPQPNARWHIPGGGGESGAQQRYHPEHYSGHPHQQGLTNGGPQHYYPPYSQQHSPAPGNSISFPTITIDEVWDRCFEDTNRYFRGRKKLQPLTEFSTLQASLDKLRGSQGRDLVFLVDDSIPMEHYRDQMAKTCRVLSYLFKKGKVDPDGQYELFFASSCTRLAADRTTDLQAQIKDRTFQNPSCEMRRALDEVFTSIMSRERPVAIYVLTDGHWDLGRLDDCDVGGSIARLVSHMWNGRKQRNWAIVQFIRFHQQPDSPADQLGQFRLNYLDNRLKEQQELAYDVVDTRDYENDLKLILEGAISYESDQSQSLGAHQPY